MTWRMGRCGGCVVCDEDVSVKRLMCTAVCTAVQYIYAVRVYGIHVQHCVCTAVHFIEQYVWVGLGALQIFGITFRRP